MPQPDSPTLTLAHTTLAVRNIEVSINFYCEALGFHVTNRGEVPGGGEIAFISQDPNNHHQIAMVANPKPADPEFVMVDHLAFRTGSLDDLRTIRARLLAAGVDNILPICHGNAWSLYFNDPEGNGLECFVDTPFHVAQPFAQGFDLDQPDAEIEKTTREMVATEPEYQDMQTWRSEFSKRLA